MNIKISSIASALLISSSFAGTLELNGGWNLVSIPSDSEIRKSDISNLETVTTFNGMAPIPSFLINNLEKNKGYWIKVARDTNLSFNDANSLGLPNLQAGWNLVGLPNITIDELKNRLENSGFKFDTITTFNGMAPIPSFLINNIDEKKGYWVKVEVLAAAVTTRDGYEVRLYVSDNNTDINNLIESIPNYSLSELGSSNLDFSAVNNIVVTKTINGETYSTPYLNPNSSNFSTELANEQNTTLNGNEAVGGTSIYVYGVNPEGSPYILDGVNIFSVNNNGTKGRLLGTTSALGYLYISNIPDNHRVIIERNGYESSIQTVQSTEGSSNYLFITSEDGSGIFSDSAIDNGTSERILNLSNAKLYKSKVGAIAIPAGSSLKRGSRIKIKNRAWNSFSLYDDVANIMEVPGFYIEPLGKMYSKGKTRENGWGYNYTFSDILEFSSTTSNSYNNIEGILAIRNLNENMMSRLENENGVINDASITNFKNHVEVYIFKDLRWQKVDQDKFKLRVIGHTNDNDTLADAYAGDRVYSNHLDAEIVVDGSVYNGPYSMFAIYKENVTSTPDLSYDNYNTSVKIVDENGAPLQNASVTLTRGSAGANIMKTTDANGIANFDILVAPHQNEVFSLNVMEGSHYPVLKTYNISALNQPDENSHESNTTLTISLMAPPEYGTVKGTVKDNSSQPIANAKVNLVFPIALANVQKDVVKVIDNKKLKGLSVSNIPNAKYSWYIKKHSDNVQNDTQSSSNRSLARVSEDRWILVQRASASQNGNFLPYNKVISQALSRPLDNDPSDIKIIPSGQFDVAVQVQHDIDGDGHFDFTELATDNSATEPNLNGEEFVNNPNNAYGRTIGFISTVIDVQKMIQDLGEIDLFNDRYYAKVNNGNWLTISDDLDGENNDDLKNKHIIPEDAFNDEDYEIADKFKLVGTQDRGMLSVYNASIPEGIGHLQKIDWDILISATIETDIGNKIVALNNDHQWVEINDPEGADAVNDGDKLIPVGKYVENSPFRDARLRISKISNKISENEFMSKLAMSLQDILNEAGINDANATHPDELMFNDGFTVAVVPTVTYSTIDDGSHEDINVSFRNLVRFDFNNMNIKDYIKLGDVVAERPILMQDQRTDLTDRVGLYSFPAVPFAFSSLGDTENSMLRINAEKLGYYESPTTNVHRFERDNVESTGEREDVQRNDISLNMKPKFNVTVNVKDQDGNPLTNAEVTIDGIYTNNAQDLNEFDSKSTKEGSSVTFNNVIGGLNSRRIVEVTVPAIEGHNYIPKIETIRNLNSNEELNITITDTSVMADAPAIISVIDKSINYNNGTATINARIFDKENGTLTDSAQIVIYQNNEIIHPVITGEGADKTITFPLEIGSNRVMIKVLNTAGTSTSSDIIFDYDPTVGAINGKVIGFTDVNNDELVDNGHMLFMDIFDENNNYINSLQLPTSGEYVLQNLEADKSFKLQVVEFDNNANVVKTTNLTNVRVRGGAMLRVDLSLNNVSQDEAVTGEPQFDFLRDITTTDINQTNGTMKVSMTLRNFDKENGQVAIFVNDIAQAIPDDQIIQQGSDAQHDYIIQDFTVQLSPGDNIVYGAAKNPSSSVDYTRDQSINWTPSDESNSVGTVNIQVNGCESENNCSILNDITTLELYDQNNNLVNVIETDTNGNASFTNILMGNYTVSALPYNSDYEYRNVNITVDENVENVDVNLTKISEIIEIPEFELTSMNFTSDEYEVNRDYNATVIISSEDENLSAYNFNWSYSYDDENGTTVNVPLNDCLTDTCTFNINRTGSVNLNVNVTRSNGEENLSKELSEEIYIQEQVVSRPPEVPNM